MEKIIYAIIMLIWVGLILIVPFYRIILGFDLAANAEFLYGCICVIIGLLILRLVKPISIILDKDYNIF